MKNISFNTLDNEESNQLKKIKVIFQNKEFELGNKEYPVYQIYQKSYDNNKLNKDIQKTQINRSNMKYKMKKKYSFNTFVGENLSPNIQFNNILKRIPKSKKRTEPRDSISKKIIKKFSIQEKKEKQINNITINQEIKEKQINKLSIKQERKDKKIYSARIKSAGREIPRNKSFKKDILFEKRKSSSNIYITKGSYSELIDIPQSEYDLYAGKQLFLLGKGMKPGEYKFRGGKILMEEKTNEEQKIILNEEEIFKEINKRKNHQKKQKITKYEILDKFYATTEFDGKPITKDIKKEQKKMECEQENIKENLMISQKKNYRYNSFNSHYEGIENKKDNEEWKSIRMYKYNKNTENCRYENDNSIILPKDNYSKYLLELINQIRIDPQSYIQVIEEAKKKITKNKYDERLIYNGKIKIALNEGGISAFDNAINYLKNIKPMEKLLFNELIVIPSPKNENDIRDKNYMKYKVEELVNKGFIIKSLWRDVIKDPESSFLLMIVDDNGSQSGMRRNDILNPNMKYIGISSNEINGYFVGFVTMG